ncbi:energy transducer TonB [Rheinheimera baltica]|uniref:energy transducer TonB n=1 Tax=Rheinheimera baltica TaxID=67576 RepID=UPI00273F5762|nr:energy transducer TonB [Rheinheimera baltica]MDP5149836.1 energy transducer TonB [Rheinheimera baltica]
MTLLTATNLPQNPALKLMTAGGAALTITFLLFAAMQQLIKADALQRQEVTEFGPIQLFTAPEDSEVEVRPPMPKPPEPQNRDIPKPQPLTVDLSNIAPGLITLGPVTLPSSAGPILQQSQTDRGAAPLVRVEPRYPVDAARDGITGWVRLGFSIDESGAVTDISVLAAEPANVFNREATRALRRWKYQPQMVEGKPIKQHNMQVQLDFSLQND